MKTIKAILAYLLLWLLGVEEDEDGSWTSKYQRTQR
jgi:hypothetical protein